MPSKVKALAAPINAVELPQVNDPLPVVLKVPVILFPLFSATDVPVPSSNFQLATKPVCACAETTTKKKTIPWKKNVLNELIIVIKLI